jgi:sulfate/thiosulfate transport system substrate-binding protein
MSSNTVEKPEKEMLMASRPLAGASLLALLVLALAAGTGAAAHSSGTTLNLVAYSTPKPVIGKIAGVWAKTAAGSSVSLTQSYGPSGSQARAIAAGQPADVAFLSTGLDVEGLVDAGLVSSSWEKSPHGGIVADSVVAFVVRGGNPKHIRGWSDLVKPGVQVVTPNPFSSGSAKWNILAAYGTTRKLGKTDKQATAFVQQLFRHVVSQDSSGANATNTFLAGKGDVLITYESEAYAALAAGKDIHILVPKQTMLIELPMVPTKKAPAQARQFIAFAQSAPAQTIFAENGYRPVDKSVLKKPALKKWRLTYTGGSRTIFEIADPIFGGWRKADRVWFDSSKGRMVSIEQEVGGPSGGGG